MFKKGDKRCLSRHAGDRTVCGAAPATSAPSTANGSAPQRCTAARRPTPQPSFHKITLRNCGETFSWPKFKIGGKGEDGVAKVEEKKTSSKRKSNVLKTGALNEGGTTASETTTDIRRHSYQHLVRVCTMLKQNFRTTSSVVVYCEQQRSPSLFLRWERTNN